MIMLHGHERTNHLMYRFEHINDSVARRRVFDRIMKTARLEHAHILEIERVGYDDTGRLCVITEYPGNQEGLVTLGDLLEARGGRLEFKEAIRLMGQLLEACMHASEQGIVHGPFTMDELLVDRHGCTLIELFGLEQALHNEYSVPDARAEQTRTVIGIGYHLATGMPFGEHSSESEGGKPSKFTKKNERHWDNWFGYAMDPMGGFDSSMQALETMPTDAEHIARLVELKPQVPMHAPKRASKSNQNIAGAVFSRFRRSANRPQD